MVIVRHVDEIARASNTGRLAHHALPNSEIVDYPQPHGADVVLAAPDAALVFPGPAVARAEPPKTLVVLDGTWAQARRMYRKIGALRGIPCLALPPVTPAAARFREAPSPDRVSTIEAIAAALALLEGEAVATPLLHLFAVACGRAAASGRRVVRSPTLDGS